MKLAPLLALLLAFSAHARIVATAGDGVSTFNLHDDAGSCPVGKRAEYINGPKVVMGCYVVHSQGLVLIEWADGDRDAIPIQAFKTPPTL
jgi:hypothetical protein